MPKPIPVVVGLSVIYVVLMVWQACMIQIGSMRTLRLESERTDLIESLRKAKRESDLATNTRSPRAGRNPSFLSI
jgi:hypothetical protein